MEADLSEEVLKYFEKSGLFDQIKKEVSKGNLAIGVDKKWAYDWWRTIEDVQWTPTRGFLLVLRSWGLFAIAVVFLVFKLWILALFSFITWAAVLELAKKKYTDNFRKYVLSNPQSFIRYHSLEAIYIKNGKTGKILSIAEATGWQSINKVKNKK
ncbi:hypothetical protein A3A48_01235 [Candidatus Curtissbacteria bacterium RIFCSPLOWO2_01_FULL_37_9]|uniref:Uncharacterized protein n=1 Tax=Candidatus Curtissbacteria bacterium RIFCSPLOWO2_01_FULL_37_9 TaxID=1797724 RepID=A0A1F5GQN1_9BACT|nr:MAG: hypothetical protein A3A48_01235 [Candidatus Curtissbacteria bacterium RIFCSPLOWO2_01_FULL_37_9]